MTRSRTEQAEAKRNCFIAHKWADDGGRARLTCYICNGMIDPATERWDAEHVIPKAIGGSDTPDNVRPCHPKCHAEKTPVDNSRTAKGKRVSDKHYGIKRKAGFRRPAGQKYNWSSGRYEPAE